MLYERLLEGENLIHFIGDLVNTPTLYTSKNGKTICRFTLQRTRAGSSFVRVPCVLYGNEAAHCKHIADKGARLEICGELGAIAGELCIIGGTFNGLDERTKRAHRARIEAAYIK